MDATLRVRGNSVAYSAVGAALVLPLTLWLLWRFDVFGGFIGVAAMLASATALGALTPHYCGRCGRRVASDAPSCAGCRSSFTESPKQRAHQLGAGHDAGEGVILGEGEPHHDHDPDPE